MSNIINHFYLLSTVLCSISPIFQGWKIKDNSAFFYSKKFPLIILIKVSVKLDLLSFSDVIKFSFFGCLVKILSFQILKYSFQAEI